MFNTLSHSLFSISIPILNRQVYFIALIWILLIITPNVLFTLFINYSQVWFYSQVYHRRRQEHLSQLRSKIQTKPKFWFQVSLLELFISHTQKILIGIIATFLLFSGYLDHFEFLARSCAPKVGNPIAKTWSYALEFIKNSISLFNNSFVGGSLWVCRYEARSFHRSTFVWIFLKIPFWFVSKIAVSCQSHKAIIVSRGFVKRI